MSIFQILGLSFLALLIALALAAASRRQISQRAAVLWILLWAAAAAAILEPELTMVVANALGIDRGADLVFYCAILGMFTGFFIVFGRLRRLDRHLTRLVRKVAIDAVEEGERAERTSPEPDATDRR
ncbi:MAG: DUF2304 family protein [Thermoanaerobaculia bacterium]